MLTPERSRDIRARLGLSQRQTAINAGVSRSNLNQFECGRWNPTEEFSATLEEFYVRAGHTLSSALNHEAGIDAMVSTNIHSSHKGPDDLSTPAANLDSMHNDVEPSDNRSRLARGLVGVGLIGGILAITGNLPVAAKLLGHLTCKR